MSTTYAKILTCMVFFLKVGVCMISRSEITEGKFKVESKKENDIYGGLCG